MSTKLAAKIATRKRADRRTEKASEGGMGMYDSFTNA
jgi:hypothetical protein